MIADTITALQLRAHLRNDEALMTHLTEVIAAAPTQQEASLALTRWAHVGIRHDRREAELQSLLSGPVQTPPAAPHSCHVAPVTGDAALPDSSLPHS